MYKSKRSFMPIVVRNISEPLTTTYTSLDLINVLQNENIRLFGQPFPFGQRVMLRHVNSLLKTYTPNQIVQAVRYAGQVAKHSFSFSFVGDILTSCLSKD
jgi:predicted membrane chloride channel (bestrophin family)